MRRRDFIAGVGGIWTFCSSSSRGQTRSKRTIANLAAASFTSAAPQYNALVMGLQGLGYAEGRDYEMVRISAEGVLNRLPALAQDVVRLKPDIIVANPTPAVVEVRKYSSTIPIVSFMLANEIRLGLVENSARPGGNVTGLLMRVDGMTQKQIQLATEIVPSARKLGILINPAGADAEGQRREAEAASVLLKNTSVYAQTSEPGTITGAFEFFARERVDAIAVLYDALFFQERSRIAALASMYKVPVVYGARDHVSSGGLISYGVSLRASAHRLAYYIDRILSGVRPGDIPLEFPTKLETVINLGVAKALGLTVPPFLLARVDEVIE